MISKISKYKISNTDLEMPRLGYKHCNCDVLDLFAYKDQTKNTKMPITVVK